jgi:hypothetical protein
VLPDSIRLTLQPGALFYMSRWYKRNELAKRYAAFYSASLLAGAFGGLLGEIGAGHLHVQSLPEQPVRSFQV